MSGDPTACSTCPAAKLANLQRLGVKMDKWDYVVALAGNPNTGKSTVFNALTGLRQHTGNWPGKTVARAEGGFSFAEKRFKVVDLPGTYSLMSASPDEEVARDFILFGQPDVTIVVVDATRLERNLNLVLQVLQTTDKVVVCLNLMDEARAHGLKVDDKGLSRDLGVPVVPTAARQGQGIDRLLRELADVAAGTIVCRPRRLRVDVPGLREAVGKMSTLLHQVFPKAPHAEWISLRLLEGDPRIVEAVTSGALGQLSDDHAGAVMNAAMGT